MTGFWSQKAAHRLLSFEIYYSANVTAPVNLGMKCCLWKPQVILTKVSYTACTTNTMYVLLNVARQVEVYDVLYIWDIQSSCCYLVVKRFNQISVTNSTGQELGSQLEFYRFHLLLWQQEWGSCQSGTGAGLPLCPSGSDLRGYSCRRSLRGTGSPREHLPPFWFPRTPESRNLYLKKIKAQVSRRKAAQTNTGSTTW